MDSYVFRFNHRSDDTPLVSSTTCEGRSLPYLSAAANRLGRLVSSFSKASLVRKTRYLFPFRHAHLLAHRKGIGIIDLFNMFPDEEAAREWFEGIRWPEGQRTCPCCASSRTNLVPSGVPHALLVFWLPFLLQRRDRYSHGVQ